ncbi:MAG TPA: glycosyltransferase [Candidatus Binatia bacterium]|jgi:glycosyltransferase involved in cell wall biosynthesis
MSNFPSVSIVIATYNRAQFLGETIRSILNQQLRNFELIVVDDGSTDDTERLLAGYRSQLRYLYQENRGPSAARNFGVRCANADWISIQDSDDLCMPNHLQTLYSYAKDHPECAMVFANGDYLGGREHNRETIIPRTKSQQLANRGVKIEDFFEKSILRLQAALISKKAYDAIGGHDESLRICMDLDLGFRLLMNFPVAYLDSVVFSYRRHAGNIGRNEELRLTENIRVIEKLLREYPRARAQLGSDTVSRRLAYRYYRLAKGRWRRNERHQAREALQQAIGLQPYVVKYRLYHWQWALGAGAKQ